MIDLINREDAIKIVHEVFGAELTRILESSDSYTLTPEERQKVNAILKYNKSICTRLKTLETQDAVEVVRCRNCNHYESCGDMGFCLLVQAGAYPDGFCAWAERREDGKG